MTNDPTTNPGPAGGICRPGDNVSEEAYAVTVEARILADTTRAWMMANQSAATPTGPTCPSVPLSPPGVTSGLAPQAVAGQPPYAAGLLAGAQSMLPLCQQALADPNHSDDLGECAEDLVSALTELIGLLQAPNNSAVD